ncbi:MAG TPA: right-handed parallel beta-helix repeat-containing protein, partial [Solirubrobacterales bacterium]|nr:right-handed parallel beta-helix repeat-containing protein [Solirubrobacterales bacterium]
MSSRGTVWGRAPGRALVLLAVGLTALALGAAPAGAASIIEVTTLADPGAGECEASGECSLREALERVASGEVGGEVEVVIEPQGTIALAGEELEVKGGGGLESIAIVGPGAAQLSVDAGGESRVFRSLGVALKVSGLTIEGGHVDDAAIDGTGGAGIYSEDGSVVLEDVRVTGNEVESFRDGGGVAIEEEAQLEVIDSRIDHNLSGHYGGGLFTDSFAPVTIRGSEIDHNEAGRGGGGIDARGEALTVTESSISWNTAGEAGGGIYAQLTGLLETSTVNGNAAAEGSGGGGLAMDSEFDSFSVISSTIAGNSGGGVRVQSGEVTVASATVAVNTTETREGAGIEGNDFRVRDSILAGNTRAGSEADCAAKVASEGGNILGSAAAASGCEWQPASGDAFETDPQLAPLTLNGGPTYTMAPASRESPAINHGAEAPSLDQRGLPRPVPEDLFDVGAVEVQAPRNLPGHEPAISGTGGAVVGDTLSCEAGEWDTDTVTDANLSFAW